MKAPLLNVVVELLTPLINNVMIVPFDSLDTPETLLMVELVQKFPVIVGVAVVPPLT